MPGPVYHVNAQTLCPHGGQGTTVSSNVRVKVAGQPVATIADTTLVAGCPFVAGVTPQPCTQVQWLAPAVRVRVLGQAVLLQTSPALCVAGTIPQGAPIITGQPRVKAI